MRRTILLILILLFAACNGVDEGPSAGTPFLGGTQGLELSFLEDTPPDTVYDKGQFPFDIVVKIDNKGEWDVPRDRIFVDILGFEPAQFGASAASLTKGLSDDLLGRGREESRQQISPSFIEFQNLNFAGEIPGAELSFPIRAQACYFYGTVATTKLCSRENLIVPSPGGLCEVNEQKTLFNSGAPIQVSSLTQSPRAADKIGFSFKINHVGTGNIFEPGQVCDESQRHLEDRVFVEVQGLPNVQCTGLEGGESARGYTTLHSGSKTITCTHLVQQLRDQELPITITLTYDYKDIIDTNILVKHSVG